MEPTITQLPYCGDAPSVFKRKPGRKKAALGAPRLQRSADNIARFANDGSLESVSDLLHKVAMTCYARVMSMGLSMNFDDVHQEMLLSYVKAKAKWNPEGEAVFNTYCKIVCENNFNHAIKKMERERHELGMVSINSLCSNEDGSADDPMELMLAAAGSLRDRPEYRMEQAGEMRANMARLSPGAKKLVSALLSAERPNISPAPRLRDLASMVGLDGDELHRVKKEILRTFGVTWQ